MPSPLNIRNIKRHDCLHKRLMILSSWIHGKPSFFFPLLIKRERGERKQKGENSKREETEERERREKHERKKSVRGERKMREKRERRERKMREKNVRGERDREKNYPINFPTEQW